MSCHATADRRKAGMFGSVLSSTIHVSPIWKLKISAEIGCRLVREWAEIRGKEGDLEAKIDRALAVLWNLDSEFLTAWEKLSPSQRESCMNALRNIVMDDVQGSHIGYLGIPR